MHSSMNENIHQMVLLQYFHKHILSRSRGDVFVSLKVVLQYKMDPFQF